METPAKRESRIYEDIEATAVQAGGTLAIAGVVVNVQWLILAGFLVVVLGVAALRIVRR